MSLRLKNRPEINGLRALAVLSVVIYHAKINYNGYYFLSGGFVGVDIFFVISGYLISSLIFKEIKKNNKLNIYNFYLRRSRRILPALFFVVSTSYIFFSPILIYTPLIEFSESAISSILFFSNIYFYLTSIVYGDPGGWFKPLLNTWSLSVEEQFYLIFPLLTVFLFKFFNKYKLNVLILLWLSSFIISIKLSNTDNSQNFYMIYTRFWELLSGIILSYLQFFNKKFSELKLPDHYHFLGLIMIIFSIFFYNDNLNFPSFYAVVPVAGTIILLINSKNYTFEKIFSIKPLIIIGLFSYSLYLWHYPIFTFFRTLNPYSVTLYSKILSVLIIIFFTYVSYKFIENRFRYFENSSNKLFFGFIISLLLFVFSFHLFIKNSNYFKDKWIVEGYNLDNFYLSKKWKSWEDQNLSYSFQSNSLSNILIVGNSHGVDTYKILSFNERFKNQTNLAFFSGGQVECFYNFIVEIEKDCKIDNKKESIEAYDNSNIILLSTKWYPKDLEIIEKLIVKLKKDKKKIIITSNIPEYYHFHMFGNFFTPIDLSVYKKNKKLGESELKKLEQDYYTYQSDKVDEFFNQKKLNLKLEKISEELEVIFLSKKDYICDQSFKRCSLTDKKGNKLFYDYAHITMSGAKFFSDKINEIKWIDIGFQ